MSDAVATSGGGGSAGAAPSAAPTGTGGTPSGGTTQAPAAAAPVDKAPATAQPVVGGDDGNSAAQEGGAPPVAEPKKYKIKARGKEFEVTDADILEQLKKEIGEDGVLDLVKLRHGSYSAFEEAKKKDQQLREAVETIRDPRKLWGMVNQVYGPEKADQVLEQWYQERQKLKNMTPEQRAEYEERQRLARDKAEIDAWKRQQAREAQQKKSQEAAKQVRERFATSLKSVGLADNDVLIARMAIKAKQYIAKGVPAVYDTMAREVREEVRAELGSLLKTMSPDQVREYLGEDHVTALRQAEADRLKAGPLVPQPRGQDGKFVPIRGKSEQQPEKPRKRPISEVFAERRAAFNKRG
jgi:chemotaxis protein histidine kinase CheA